MSSTADHCACLCWCLVMGFFTLSSSPFLFWFIFTLLAFFSLLHSLVLLWIMLLLFSHIARKVSIVDKDQVFHQHIMTILQRNRTTCGEIELK